MIAWSSAGNQESWSYLRNRCVDVYGLVGDVDGRRVVAWFYRIRQGTKLRGEGPFDTREAANEAAMLAVIQDLNAARSPS